MRASQRALVLNWVLLAIACLSLSLVVATSGFLSSGERQARARHLMTAFRLDDIRELTLHTGGQRMVLRRRSNATGGSSDPVPGDGERDGEHGRGPRWLMVAPLEAQAEEGRVDQLLRDLRFATWEREIPAEAVDETAFGLHQPDPVIEVEMGPIRYELRLGASAPAPAGARYLQVTGERAPNPGVYVVSRSTVQALTVGVAEFRIRQIVPFGRSAIARLELTQGPQSVAVERQPGTRSGVETGDWFRFSRQFGGARINAEVMDRVFWSLARSEAQHFVEPSQAAQLQSQHELLKVTLETKDGTALELHFGGACPQDDALVVVTRHRFEPTSACVEGAPFGDLLKRPELLIDRQLFSFRVDELERLKVAQGEQRMDLLRQDDGFVLRQPVEGSVDRALGQQRLEAMLGARGEWLAGAPAGLDPASLTHSVVLSSSAASEEAVREQQVSFSPAAADGSHFAYRHQDGAWLRVKAAAARAMQPDALLIRSRQLLELQDREVKRIEVRTPSFTQVLEQPQRGEFHLRAPQGYPVDAGLAVELVDVMAGLTLERWVSPHEQAQFELAVPRLQVALDSDSGRVLDLRVGAAAAEGGYYATREGDPAVFTLRAATVERLETLLISRSLLMIDAAELSALQLMTPARRVELSRLGLDLVQVGGAEQLHPERIEQLLGALGLIRAEAAIALDASQGKYGFERPALEVTAHQGTKPPLHWVVGARDLYRDMSVYYVRLKGEQVVFAVPTQHLYGVLEPLR